MNEATKHYNKSFYNSNEKLMKQNVNTPYKSSSEDKLKILNELDTKASLVKNFSSKIRGNKNLVYYTISGIDYIMLLELSLKSLIVNNLNKSFDVLIITDEYTLKLLNAVDCLKEFNWHYHLIPLPRDGIEASMAKLKIFSYEKINEYSKILFLDADIICRGNFLDVFSTSTNGKLEAVHSPIVKKDLPSFPGLYKSTGINYSLGFFTEANKEYILKNDPWVFNAGQFYIENTEQMEQHFKNIIWLTEIWPTVYFFEQSYMNQYFNFNELVSYAALDKHVSTMSVLISIIINLDPANAKQHEDSCTLIHFAGVPTDGFTKYLCIKRYCDYFNICL